MSDTLAERGEGALVELLGQALTTDRALDVPIGDDGAVYVPRAGRQVAVADAMIEDVHFARDICPLETVGRKLVAVNVSDLAAMGAEPDVGLFTAALPGALSWKDTLALVHGVAMEAARHGVTIVGGDVTGTPGPIALSLTLLGTCDRPLVRTTAVAGDSIWLTRALGGAALGLRALRASSPAPISVRAFLTPAPELAASRALRDWAGCHAVMDVSDGLAPDAARLAKASAVGLDIDLDCVPIAREVQERVPDEALTLALYGGEDYALLFTGSGAPPVDAIKIGTVTGGSGVRWLRDGRVAEAPAAATFDHFALITAS